MQISNVPLFQLINLKSSILTERTFQKKVLTAVSWAPLPQKATHLRYSPYFIYIYELYIAIKKQNQFLSFNITGSLEISFGTDTLQACSNVSKRIFIRN